MKGIHGSKTGTTTANPKTRTGGLLTEGRYRNGMTRKSHYDAWRLFREESAKKKNAIGAPAKALARLRRSSTRSA